ncbi:hypothetical protein HN011_001535 [Eciton burchellii]|nr:hypothetical protein HN011_001535 [Eciton burchellii]
MSEHGDSDMDATEEINVDDSDSRSCSPRNYASHDGRHVSQDECSSSPPPSQTGARTLSNDSPRSHPFSISRLLGESGVQNPKSPSSEEPDSDKERKWSWEEGNNNNNNDNTSNNNNNNNNNNSQATPAGLLDQDPGRRSWGHDVEEKLSEKDDDDSAPDARTNSSSSVHCASAADLLAPFRLFPAGTGLIYTGGGVIRVPAHRPPGANGAPAGALPAQALIPPWSLQALQHSQQQAAAAGLHRASILANLAAHPLQAHPHLKDRLADIPKRGGKLRRFSIWFRYASLHTHRHRFRKDERRRRSFGVGAESLVTFGFSWISFAAEWKPEAKSDSWKLAI